MPTLKELTEQFKANQREYASLNAFHLSKSCEEKIKN